MNRTNQKQNNEHNQPETIYPARVTAGEAAEILGFEPDDIRILVSQKLLRPLGKPVQNATKYFATCDIKQVVDDSGWLNKATQALYEYWAQKNAKKTANKSPSNLTSENGIVALTE